MPTRKPCASCCTGYTSHPTLWLHFSPYALLREVVENEFADEVAESGREAFCRKLYPHLTNLFAGYGTSDDTFALSPGHDLLYTELVGTVMLYLEGTHGVQ